jgi:GNAT superfamily N-acetyltransferase
MTVEHMRPEDWERVRAVRLRALEDAPDAFLASLEKEEAMDPDSWRARLASPDARTFVATWQGQDVGLVTGAEFRGREPAAGLFGMWTAPERRVSGLGTELVAAVIDWARSAGYERLLLEVEDTNAAAIRLYERMGFTPTGVTSTYPAPRSHLHEHERELILIPVAGDASHA